MLYLIINYNKKNINNEIADICETGAYESVSILISTIAKNVLKRVEDVRM